MDDEQPVVMCGVPVRYTGRVRHLHMNCEHVEGGADDTVLAIDHGGGQEFPFDELAGAVLVPGERGEHVPTPVGGRPDPKS